MKIFFSSDFSQSKFPEGAVGIERGWEEGKKKLNTNNRFRIVSLGAGVGVRDLKKINIRV